MAENIEIGRRYKYDLKEGQYSHPSDWVKYIKVYNPTLVVTSISREGRITCETTTFYHGKNTVTISHGLCLVLDDGFDEVLKIPEDLFKL